MAEERIDSYVDRAAIADDTKFLTNELKTVLEQLNAVNSVKITLSGAKSMKEVVDGAKQAQTAIAGLEASKDKLIKVDLQAAKASVLEAKAKKELALAQKAEAQARKENAAAALLEAKAVKSVTQAEKEHADALLKGQKLTEQEERKRVAQAKAVEAVINDYLLLSKAYNEAALKAKNYALTLGETHPITVEAVKDAKAMHDILLRVDHSVGQSQRNVGNYKSAFDGLGFSFTQIARELPSLAISAQQFILAISNNLPMVQDEIRKARLEIAALRAQGKEAPTLFRAIASSILTWNVALSIGITLLTVYGKELTEWVSGLFKGSNALYEAANRQEAINDLMVQGAKNIGDEVAHLRVLEKVATDVSIAQETRLKAAKEMQELYPSFLKNLTQEQILNGQAAEAINEAADALLNKALAHAAEAKASELGTKRLELQLKALKLNKELEKANLDLQKADAAALANKDKYKKEEIGLEQFTTIAKRTELRKQINDNKAAQEQINSDIQFFLGEAKSRQGDVFKLDKQKEEERDFTKFFAGQLQKRADIARQFSEFEDLPIRKRIEFRKAAYDLERQILEGQFKDELIGAEANQVKILEVKRRYGLLFENLEEKFEEDKAIMRGRYIERQRQQEAEVNAQFQEDAENRLRALEDAELKAFDTRKDYLEENGDILLRSLEVERNAKIKSAQSDKERQRLEEYYNNRRKEIEIQTNVDILQSALATAEEKLKIANKGTNKNAISELNAQIASLKQQLEKLKGVKIDLNIDDARDKIQALAADIQEATGQLFKIVNSIGDILGADIDKEKNALQDQIDLITKRKEVEIEAINASALSEQEKADKIAIINERAQAQKEVLEQRQRQLEIQRARFEKGATIARIVADTAAAIVAALGAKPYTPANIAQASIIGAIGATQLAAAIATPLPKFKYGRENGPATFGIVGDGGKREVMTSPDLKQAFVTPATDTLAYLPKDWKVFPDIDAFQEAAAGMSMKPLATMPVINNHFDEQKLGNIISAGYRRVESAIMSRPEHHTYLKNGEVKKMVKKANQFNRYIQDNV